MNESLARLGAIVRADVMIRLRRPSTAFMFVLISIPVTAPMVFAADRFAAAMKRSPRVTRAVDWLFAGVFSAFALKIITAQAKECRFDYPASVACIVLQSCNCAGRAKRVAKGMGKNR